MTKVAPIEQRKADHIKINLEKDVRSALTTGLEHYHFTHEALPELDLKRVDTSLERIELADGNRGRCVVAIEYR